MAIVIKSSVHVHLITFLYEKNNKTKKNFRKNHFNLIQLKIEYNFFTIYCYEIVVKKLYIYSRSGKNFFIIVIQIRTKNYLIIFFVKLKLNKKKIYWKKKIFITIIFLA